MAYINISPFGGMGMPSGMGQLLQEKYRQSGIVAQANANQSNAAANLNNQQARMVRPETESRIRLNDANTYKTTQEGDVIKPMTTAEINRINAWIRASDAGVVNQNKTTDANVGFVKEQTRNQYINNEYLPLEKRQALERSSIENKYLGPKMQSEINYNNSGATLNRSNVDVNKNNIRNSNGMIPKPADEVNTAPAPAPAPASNTVGQQGMLAPMPNALSPFTPNAALAALYGSRGQVAQASPAVAPVTVKAQPSAPVVQSPIQIALAAPTVGNIEPAGIPGMAPVIRREVTPSFLDEEGESAFMSPFKTAARRSPFMSSLTLKRGTARVPGKGEGDKVPALLEPGEAVLNKHAAGLIGRDKIAKANAKGNNTRAKEAVSKLAQSLKLMGMA